MSEPQDWQPEVDELNTRRKMALKMGGEERVRRQHELGKLTIRERIDAITDPGSFHEIGGLAGYGSYENREFVEFKPLPYIGGLAKVDGRRVVIGGEDFTVGGGAADISTQERFKSLFLADMAREYRVPLIVFHEGAGANVAAEGDGHGHLPSSFDVFGPDILAGKEVPLIFGVAGACAGGVAARAMLGHFTVMTPNGALFAGGPPLVKRALGPGDHQGSTRRARHSRASLGSDRQPRQRRARCSAADETVPALHAQQRLRAAGGAIER